MSAGLAFTTLRAKSFQELVEIWEKHFNRPTESDPYASVWVFRGHGDVSWPLASALDRSRSRFKIAPESVALLEEGLLREFVRHVGNATESRLPRRTNILEWLALMRHYGGPTRLLDWTYSFFVALYFAVETGESDCAVWAIDARWCNKRSREAIADTQSAASVELDPYFQKPETFKNLFARQEPVPLVYRVNSFLLNTRLARQKGLFLCAGDPKLSFADNLECLQRMDEEPETKLFQIEIGTDLRREIMQRLFFMNIGSDTLFGDVDGLARSLNSRLVFPHVLVPAWRKKMKAGPFENWEILCDQP